MRLIDADALKEIICKNVYPLADAFNSKDYGMFWTGGIEKAIDEAPTVDAVPVIRCKDCKFSKAYYHGSESNLGMFTYLCTQGLYGMNADDFCSRAERMDGDRDEPAKRL